MSVALSDDTWTENRPSRGLRGFDFRELWRYREVAYLLAIRDLKLRYKQTFFGVAWAVLQPLAAMGIFALVFGRLTHVPSEGVPYAVFVYAGLAFWFYTSTSVTSAAESLADNRDLVTKIYFPRMLAPLAAVSPALLDLAVSLAVVFVLIALYGVAVTPALLLLPLWILGVVLVALGASLWLSALNALYRDIRYALSFVLQLWLFTSPVIYPSSLFHAGGRAVYAINPMVGLLDGMRWSLIDTPAPGRYALISLAGGVLLLLSGAMYFRHVERRFADHV
jgi:lipopolysaccharide transport system permease protein